MWAGLLIAGATGLPCQCPTSTLNLNAANVASPVFSTQDETIDGVNYGKLIHFGTTIMTVRTFQVYRGINSLPNECPPGWGLPSDAQLAALAALPYSLLTDPNGLNMSAGYFYMSAQKSFPNITNGADNNAWAFDTFQLNQTIQPVVSYWQNDNLMMKAKCVRISGAVNTKGVPTNDLIAGVTYNFEIINSNAVSYQWQLGNDVVSTKSSISLVPATTDPAGCAILTITTTLFGGVTMSTCYSYWVVDPDPARDVATDLSLSIITDMNLNISAWANTGLHFSPGSTPIAPKPDGNMYIYYATPTDYSLKVLELTASGSVVKTWNLGAKGEPFDILARPWGFVVLNNNNPDNDRLLLTGYNLDGSQKFQRVLMDNPNHQTVNEQISFPGPPFGMRVMFNPHNGRLNFARGRIIVTFAHYNNFSVEGHTGDTLLYLDEMGQNGELAYSWGASHSLCQRMLYDGGRVVTAALGDAFPQQLRFAVSDVPPTPAPSTSPDVNSQSSSSILDGSIPGNGGGAASGRLGGLSMLSDGSFVASYARRPCSTNFEGTPSASSLDETGLIFFNTSLVPGTKVVLGPGDTTNFVKSAKYGANLLVAYGTVPTPAPTDEFLSGDINSIISTTFLLTSASGQVLKGPFQLPGAVVNANDDFEVLADGRVAWTYVKGGSLHYVSLPALPAPPATPAPGVNGNPVKTSGTVPFAYFVLALTVALLHLLF